MNSCSCTSALPTFLRSATACSGPGPPNYQASPSHEDTPPSVGLLWTSDQPNAETSYNTQHSQETDILAPGGI